MIKIVTKINTSRLMPSITSCKGCGATIEFGSFSPVVCHKCRLFIPNYTHLLKEYEAKIEYYKKGRICGIPAD